MMATAPTIPATNVKKCTPGQRNKPPCLALQPSLVQDNLPCEVIPKLWVGSVHAAFNFEAIKERKITHVLNVSGTIATYPHEFTYLTVDLRDKDYTNLLSCIPIATVFLESGMQQGGILVHCAGGRSRSPAIVIAYLMSALGHSFDDAISKVRIARPVVQLNSGFEDQLRCFEKAKRDVYAAHQLLLQTKIVRARLRRSQLLDVDYIPTPKSSTHASKKASSDVRMLLGTLPRGFYLSRPSSPKDQQFIPPLRTMGTQYGCAACGTLLYCAANVLRHNDTTDAALWTVAIDRKRAISCPETPRGRHGAPLPVGRPFADNEFDEDDDETLQQEMLRSTIATREQSAKQAQHAVVTPCDDDLDATLGAAIHDVELRSGTDGNTLKSVPAGKDNAVAAQVRDSQPQTQRSEGHIVTSSNSSRPTIKQSKKNWRSWASLRPSFGFRKAQSEPTGPASDELQTWRQQMKALEKHGSRHQIRRVSAAMSEDEKQFAAVDGTSKCHIVFLEPLAWFGSVQPEDGNLVCSNSACRATVGHYTWSDADTKHQCACGGQVCPGFAVHKSAVKMLPGPSRLPPPLASREKDLT
ncbi:hypothetical protein H310_03825 [Aphanomyces invadans]|uniref:protein-tyrosine-phosphatase n=1 Tax=Aphanomyces invadans TaxID=157072 RepID=A0A024UED3_9STRA|nr:hypothetical protein H310_03825 [Aphanomyces invadans]ETW04634.1 hypothetical protein H310_03825 [Aphanomyces invadans]|eukprot:XP_008866072.1 hypothetical protein H310_03825 [Aphanomyces invadans]